MTHPIQSGEQHLRSEASETTAGQERKARSSRRLGGLVAAVLGVAIVSSALVASGAKASFPGSNGKIAYIGGVDIYLVDPAGGTPQQLTSNRVFYNVAVDATGTKLVAQADSGTVFLSPTPGSAITQHLNGNPNDVHPSFDPTGTKVTFEYNSDIWVQDVAGGNRTNITNSMAFERNPEWSADGSFIAFHNDDTYQVERISPTGGNRTVLTPPNADCDANDPCRNATVSANNMTVAYDQNDEGIHQVLASGGSNDSLRLTDGANDRFPSYSPQGDRVAFEYNGIKSAPTDGSMTRTSITAFGYKASWGVAASSGGPALSINDVQRTRGTCSFTVTLVPSAQQPVTVNHATADADGDAKFTPGNGTLSFAAGETTKQVVVQGVKRAKKTTELDVNLSSPSGAAISDPSGVCSIKKKRR